MKLRTVAAGVIAVLTTLARPPAEHVTHKEVHEAQRRFS